VSISFVSQAFRSGSLCGGYRDKSKSVISTYRHYISLQELLKEAEKKKKKIKDLIKNLKDKMTKHNSDKQKLERKIINAK
jgi:chromosome segregation ATPase